MKRAKKILATLGLIAALPVCAQTLYIPSGTSGIGASSTANVGIGTASPGLKLDVVSSLGTTDGIRFTGASHAWLWVKTNAASGSTAGVEMVGGAPGADWLMFTNRGDITPNADDFSIYKNVAGTGTAGPKLTIQSNGNVGISSAAPDRLLTIYGADRSNQLGGSVVGIHLVNSDAGAAGRVTEIAFGGRAEGKKPFAAISGVLGADTAYEQSGDLVFSTKPTTTADYPTERMRILYSGNIGVGTTAPVNRLEISGTNAAAAVSGTAANGATRVSGAGTSIVLDSGVVGTNTHAWLQARDSTSYATNYNLALNPNGGNVGIGITDPGVTKLRVVANSGEIFKADDGATAVIRARSDGTVTFEKGNVGIGTPNPTQKLSVNGIVQAKEVIVQTGWSDYVFKSDYRLAPLSEIENAIQKEGHLPGIPSAKQVAEQGVSLGEMQAKLLAKIEELTLHQIELSKQLEALRNENGTLRSRVVSLEAVVDVGTKSK